MRNSFRPRCSVSVYRWGFPHTSRLRRARGDEARGASSGTGLLEPQHEFLDLAGACFSEASFLRDDTKATLLEDVVRRDIVIGDACMERTRRINSPVHAIGCRE